MATKKPQPQTDATEKFDPELHGTEPEVQDVDEVPDSTDVQDVGVTEPEVEGSASTASHYDPQGHPVTISPALHEFHEARGYTRITG